MTSLTQLNESAASPIEVTDARPAGVIFDRFATRDDVFTVSSLNRQLVPQIGINEIINYSTANVRYRLTINSTRAAFITGSTLTFNGMPTGVSVSTSTSTYTKAYTVTGLKSAKQFDQIKTPTWNIPGDYALSNTWWVKTEIIYYDGELEQDVTKEWYVFDPEYYYFAQLEASAAVSATIGNKKPFAAALTGVFEFNSDAPYKSFKMNATASSLVTANGRKARLLSANLSTGAFGLDATGMFYRLDLRANLTATATLTCQPGEYVRLVNQAAFTAVFGPIGPAGVPYLEGNGFAYGTGLGSWPQGFPGIVRIKSLSAAIATTSTVTCIGADARLVSAMVMSSGTMTISATRIPGIIKNLTAAFNVNLPDGGNIEGARAQFGGEFYATATPFYSLGFFSEMQSATSLTAAPRYTGIVPTITSRNYVGIANYNNDVYALVRGNSSLFRWQGSGDLTSVSTSTPIFWNDIAINSTGTMYAVINITSQSPTVLGDLYSASLNGTFSATGQTLRSYERVIVDDQDNVWVTAGGELYKLVNGVLTVATVTGYVASVTFNNGFMYVLTGTNQTIRLYRNNTAYNYNNMYSGQNYTLLQEFPFDGDGSFGNANSIIYGNDNNLYLAFDNIRPLNDGDASISGCVWRVSTTANAPLTKISKSNENWYDLAKTANGNIYAITTGSSTGQLYLVAYTS